MTKYLVSWEETNRYVGVVEADSQEEIEDNGLETFDPQDPIWTWKDGGSEILSVEEQWT